MSIRPALTLTVLVLFTLSPQAVAETNLSQELQDALAGGKEEKQYSRISHLTDPMTDEQSSTLHLYSSEYSGSNGTFIYTNPIESVRLTCYSNSATLTIGYREDRARPEWNGRANRLAIRMGKYDVWEMVAEDAYRPNQSYMISNSEFSMSIWNGKAMAAQIYDEQRMILKIGGIDAKSRIINIDKPIRKHVLELYNVCDANEESGS
ncbi:hypothetical protein EKG38_14015 [Shewanella canadensis]|uniref:Uncharacterized protein n=1 Tax=Shewanella canadensis TaxID=271096 RepID=A0A431WTQ6_9GAMM|nr:hypothetical protein [Shewanella canadensis]RTR38615.1 hypothetical protein EKG38_14015 [Shewanella canadensis]